MGFKIIKDLVRQWWDHAINRKSVAAAALLKNLVKWMCAEGAGFFDPSIKLSLDKLAKKLFDELLAKLNAMGARVVYASPQRLLVDTRKSTRQSGENFISFVF